MYVFIGGVGGGGVVCRIYMNTIERTLLLNVFTGSVVRRHSCITSEKQYFLGTKQKHYFEKIVFKEICITQFCVVLTLSFKFYI